MAGNKQSRKAMKQSIINEVAKQFKVQQDTNNRLHDLMKTFAPYMNTLFGTY